MILSVAAGQNDVGLRGDYRLAIVDKKVIPALVRVGVQRCLPLYHVQGANRILGLRGVLGIPAVPGPDNLCGRDLCFRDRVVAGVGRSVGESEQIGGQNHHGKRGSGTFSELVIYPTTNAGGLTRWARYLSW